jgi:DNA (cytosine-5)-methyltransferase 1
VWPRGAKLCPQPLYCVTCSVTLEAHSATQMSLRSAHTMVNAMAERPNVLSLYSGAGGIDYGLEAAGFQTAVAIEWDHDCCETLRASRPTWTVVQRSIFEVPTAEMLECGGLKRGEVDLLAGGPPCQPFSKAGYWSSGDSLRLDDPRADTLSAYMRVVEQALPNVFLLENVEGLAFAGKDEGLTLLKRMIAAINKRTKSNYQPAIQVLSATDYGVPQQRERVIMVATRDGTPFEFPQPAFRPIDIDPDDEPVDLSLPAFRTAWDAIADLKPEPSESLDVRGKWADLLPTIPEGNNYLHHTARGKGVSLFGWRRRYWSFLLKLAKNRPSWTIQAQPGPAIGPFHWDSRRLSVRELCRLQTFPDDVKVMGGRLSQQRQLGNAVPSLLAEVLGREIGRQFFGMKSRNGLKLLPPDRSPTPPPKEPAPLPQKFEALIGDYEAHPGTGRGYGALARAVAE